MRRTPKHVIAAACMLSFPSVLAVEGECAAALKEECVEAHVRAQDLREKGQLSRAKLTFMTCAQSSCPSLVQGDCARNVDELAHLLPTVTFSARDSSAADLPNTSVYVDDVFITSRLDEGKTYEIDPGRHTLRYVHEGKETTIKVVLNQGEKGRVLLATFLGGPGPTTTDVEVAPPSTSAPRRSALPLVVAGLGGAAALAGGILFGTGIAAVPDRCSVATKECAGPPDDPALDEARAGVSRANTGAAIGIGGAIVLVGGLLWYFLQPSSSGDARVGRSAQPFITF